MSIIISTRPKSEWQNDNCPFCEEKAVKEVACTKGNVTVPIRYCGNALCEEKATKRAKQSLQS